MFLFSSRHIDFILFVFDRVVWLQAAHDDENDQELFVGSLVTLFFELGVAYRTRSKKTNPPKTPPMIIPTLTSSDSFVVVVVVVVVELGVLLSGLFGSGSGFDGSLVDVLFVVVSDLEIRLNIFPACLFCRLEHFRERNSLPQSLAINVYNRLITFPVITQTN